MSGTYVCAACNEEFEEGWSEEEALAEKEELWGNIPLEECIRICEDCFQNFMDKIRN